MGEELSSIGVDIDFAPVLDVLTNTANTVIGDRAFASDPQTVGLFGCAQARGLRAGGVIPCGKHFPGPGATLIDSHPPILCIRFSTPSIQPHSHERSLQVSYVNSWVTKA
jgi:beta-glucosidase-like glycosyl hydrolase